MAGKNGDKGNDVKVKEQDLIPYIKDSAVDNTFKDPESTNAMALMMLSDPEFINNLFKYNVPDIQFAIAMADQIKSCQEHGYTPGVNVSIFQLGLMASVKSERIKDFVQAIAGDRQFRERQGGGGGFIDKIKKMYGNNE